MNESAKTPPLAVAPRKIPFKVDIAGVIHIMGTALYSRSEAAIRELIQNGHDAVLRRRRQDLRNEGKITSVFIEVRTGN